MPIETSMYGQLNTDAPLSLAKFLDPATQAQRQLQVGQAQEGLQALSDDAKTRQFYKDSPVGETPMQAVSRAKSAGLPVLANTLFNQAIANQKVALDTQHVTAQIGQENATADYRRGQSAEQGVKQARDYAASVLASGQPITAVHLDRMATLEGKSQAERDQILQGIPLGADGHPDQAKLTDWLKKEAVGPSGLLPKLSEMNTGGTIQPIARDPITGAVTNTGPAMPTTPSASAVLSSDTTKRGQNMVDARTRELQGILQRPTGSPDPDQAIIDAIGRKEMAAPTARSPRNVVLLNKVAQQYAGQDAAHPVFDAAQFPMRQRAEIAFATGKQGDQVRNASNIVEHIGTMSDLMSGLNNGSVPFTNVIKNQIATMTGQPAPTNVKAAAGILGGEITKVIVGNGLGTESDRKDVGRGLDLNASPEQQQGALSTVTKLLATQMRDLENQKKATTGTGFKPGFINARAQQFLDKAKLDEATRVSGSAPPAKTAGGATVSNW